MKPYNLILAGLLIALPVRANLVDVYATSFPNSYPTLEMVNLSNGQITPLGTVNWGGILNDIAVNPNNGALFGLSGANLFTINSHGAVTPVVATGMNGSMESLAFDAYGDLYVATQSSLYKYAFADSSQTSGNAVYLGDYNNAPLNGTGQNIRFNGSTLYVTDTQNNGSTSLFSVSTNNGNATLIGVVTNQPSLVLGNNGSHLLGSAVPAINGGAAVADLLDFGTQVATVVNHGEVDVQYTVVQNSFPENVNFSQGGFVEAVPEPKTWILWGLGLAGLIVVRRIQTRTGI